MTWKLSPLVETKNKTKQNITKQKNPTKKTHKTKQAQNKQQQQKTGPGLLKVSHLGSPPHFLTLCWSNFTVIYKIKMVSVS